MITITNSRPMPSLCGFCTTGAHHYCPRNVTNGDETTVMICPCECDRPIRCVNCSDRSDINPNNFNCNDLDACSARIQRSITAATERLYNGSTRPDAPENRPKSQKTPRKAAEKRTGSCLCCSEPTKGGLFLPGHDSKYLARAVEAILDTNTTLQDALAHWESVGISEGLRGKLQKKVGQ